MTLGEATTAQLRRVVKQGGACGTYARVELAAREGNGVRLSYNDCEDMLLDEAISAAILSAIYDNELEDNLEDAPE